MNWKTLKNRYPEIWGEVEEGVLNDMKEILKGDELSRCAHNAAFLACDAVRRNKYLVDINRK